MDRCAGQCDNKASHDDSGEALALLEPMPTEAMVTLKEVMKPTTYTLSRLDQLLHPSMTKVWGGCQRGRWIWRRFHRGGRVDRECRKFGKQGI